MISFVVLLLLSLSFASSRLSSNHLGSLLFPGYFTFLPIFPFPFSFFSLFPLLAMSNIHFLYKFQCSRYPSILEDSLRFARRGIARSCFFWFLILLLTDFIVYKRLVVISSAFHCTFLFTLITNNKHEHNMCLTKLDWKCSC